MKLQPVVPGCVECGNRIQKNSQPRTVDTNALIVQPKTAWATQETCPIRHGQRSVVHPHRTELDWLSIYNRMKRGSRLAAFARNVHNRNPSDNAIDDVIVIRNPHWKRHRDAVEHQADHVIILTHTRCVIPRDKLRTIPLRNELANVRRNLKVARNPWSVNFKICCRP